MSKKPKRTFYLKVAGVTFDNPDGINRQEIVKRARAGQPVLLMWEIDNPYSDNDSAVAVFTPGGHQLGYLPDGHRLEHQVERGVATATIKGVHGGGFGKSYGCTLNIHIWYHPQDTGYPTSYYYDEGPPWAETDRIYPVTNRKSGSFKGLLGCGALAVFTIAGCCTLGLIGSLVDEGSPTVRSRLPTLTPTIEAPADTR
ncbi:MAG: HIRAN domain-containing protein [Anaerolineae bacterium]|nr:HIRAN domain-containing protein [Anaerolineae bacterium]